MLLIFEFSCHPPGFIIPPPPPPPPPPPQAEELPKLLHISGAYHILKWFFDNSCAFFETSINALQEWRLVINSNMLIVNQPSLLQKKFTYEQITV